MAQPERQLGTNLRSLPGWRSRRPVFAMKRRWQLTRIVLWPLLWLAAGGPAAQAVVVETFESAEPSWQVVDSDCRYRLEEHRRTLDEAHSGNASEYVRLRAEQGSRIYLGQRVSPAPVISELIPSLWVKSDRAGLQLLARVVLPRTRDPATGRPMTAYVAGDVYREVLAWRQLRIDDVMGLLGDQVRVLRARHRNLQVDAHEAYIDFLMLNVHPGRGVANVWIDELALAGFASASRQPPAGLAVTAAGSDPWPAAAGEGASPRVRGSMIVIDDRPFFARIIEHNGESFSWLASLGFNVVKLASPPTDAQLQQARATGIWLIAPPPDEARLAAPRPRRVLAWDVGAGLPRVQADSVRQLALRLRAADAQATPLVCTATGDVAALSHLADVLLYDRPIPGTSSELVDYGPWLQERSRLARPDQPFWAAVATEPAVEHVEQLRLMAPGAADGAALEPEQIWLLAYQAVSGGARGLCFRSRSRLDAADSSARLRAAALQLLNQQLEAIQPWVAAGVDAGPVEVSDPRIRARLLKTQRARLLVATQLAAQQQFVVGPVPDGLAVTFHAGGVPITDQTYRIEGGELLPLPRGAGAAIPCDRPELVTLIVSTQDPLAVNHLGRALGRHRADTARLTHELAAAWHERVRETSQRLERDGQAVAGAAAWLAQADAALRQSRQLLDAGDPAAAQRLAEQALNRLRRLRHRYWQQATQAFTSPVSSPLCSSFLTLPAHYEMARQSRQWQTNSLAAGDFESLQHLIGNGWRQQHHERPGSQTLVELSPHDVRSGRLALRLRAWSPGGDGEPVLDAWPLHVTSGPVPVRRGQLVRIHGWVNVPQPVRGSHDGLLVFDSLTGLTLAERIPITRGWREFTLYRAAPRDGELSITFALTGFGEAWVDDVAVTIAE